MGFKGLWGLLKSATKNWIADNAQRLGAALAFYTVFAVSPLFIIAIFVASLVFDQTAVRAALFDQVADLAGQKGARALESALAASLPHQQGVFATMVAVITWFVMATGVFMELQAALNRIWGVEPRPGQGIWGFLKARLLSFAMVMVIGFLLLVSLVVSAVLAALAGYVSALVPRFDMLMMIANGIVSFGVITLLFAGVFKVLPDVKISWGDVWIGAGVTALLFTGGKFLLGLYLGQNSTVSAYGAAGSLVLILLWVYYSAQILFFGAELTQAYANRYGSPLAPKAHARWIRPPPRPAADPPAAPRPAPRETAHPPPKALVPQLERLRELRERARDLRARARAQGH